MVGVLQKGDQNKMDEFLKEKFIFFPLKEKLKLIFLMEQLQIYHCHVVLLSDINLGLLCIFLIYTEQKSEKFHDEVYKIQKRINASEVTTDPRATKKMDIFS